MKKQIEIQKENVKTLLDLVKENPDLRILPMVDYEVVGGDDYSNWGGSFGKAEIDYTWNNGERIHFMSHDFEELIENEVERLDNAAQVFSEKHPLWRSNEERAEKMVKNLDWEKVIVVQIDTP